MFDVKKIIFITIFFLFETVAFAIPPSFVFQGQIIKPDGQPLEASPVTFTLQVLSSTNQCLLYEETHVLNMSGSNGLFSLSTGNGANTGNGGLADLTTAMNNSLGNQTGLSCVSGTAYDPASGDTRRLRVTFDDGSGPITVSQDHTIQSVPYAQYAGTLEGKSASDFAQINSTTAGVTQANLEAIFDNGSNYTELLALLVGTSSNYTPIGSSGAGNLPSFTNAAPPTAPSAGDVWFNTDSNQILYYDGTSTQPVGGGSGTVTSITAGSGLSGGAITTSGTISVTAGGITNAHLASGIDAAKVTTGTLPVGVVPSGTDATKLPLAGGTMTGNITMGGNQVLGAGHITQAAQSTITLGSYTNAQETTLVGSLGAANAGATWYNSDSGELKYWDGTAAVKLNNTAASISSVTASAPLASSGGATPDISINLGNGLYNNGGNVDIDLATDPGLEFNSNKLRVKVNSGIKRTASGVEADIGTSAGQLIAIDDIPNCTASQKIQMSAGPVYTLSCVADVDTTLSGSAAGGDLAGNYPNPTIATGAVTTAKLSNSGATAGTYPKVTVDVKGRVTSGSALVASDIPNLDAAKITTGTLGVARIPDLDAAKITSGTLATARLDVGTGNNQIVQLDGTSKLPAVDGSQLTNLPAGSNITSATDVTITADDDSNGSGDIDFIIDATTGMSLENNGDLIVDTNALFVDASTDRVGLGVLTPSYLLSLDGQSSQTIGQERNITADTAGNALTLQSSGATTGATDKDGGALSLSSGIATGTGSSSIEFKTATPQGGTNTTDNVPTTKMTILGNGKVGVGTATPDVELDVNTGVINASQICDESNSNCIDLSSGVTTSGSSEAGSSSDNYVINTDSDNAGGDGGVDIQTNGSTVANITSSGNIQSTSGAASTPGLSFTGDTNTGLFNPAADTLSMAAGGVEALRLNTVTSGVNYVEITPAALGDGPIISTDGADTNIDLNITPKGTGNTVFTNGNVGIGTTNPEARLHILGPAVNGTLRLSNTEGNNNPKYSSILTSHYQNSTEEPVAMMYTATTSSLNNINIGGGHGSFNAATEIQFFTAADNTTTTGTERMTINSSGNVGIGTTNPTELLQLKGSRGSIGLTDSDQFTDPNDHIYINPVLDDLRIGWSDDSAGTDSDIMRIGADGNVGIGTTSPEFSLDIRGGAHAPNQNVGLQIGVPTGQWKAGFKIKSDGGGSKRLAIDSPDTGTIGGMNEAISIDANGNVGIGTTTPAVELDVDDGVINASQICDESNSNCIDLSSGVTTSESSEAGSSSDNYVINTDSDNTGSDGGIDIQTNGSTVANITSSGNIQSTSGAASTPGLSFTGDTNTGIFNPAADTLSMAAGGVEALRLNTVASGVNYVEITPAAAGNGPIISTDGADTNIDLNITPKGTGNTVFTNGNVGIGTASPNASLDLKASGPFWGNKTFILSSSDDNDSGWQIQPDNKASSPTLLRFGYRVDDADPTSTPLVLTENGSVGIGTTSPGAKLEIAGSTTDETRMIIGADAQKWALVASGSVGSGGTAPGSFSIREHGSTVRMVVQDGTGNVGLGTTAPTAKLDISDGVTPAGSPFLNVGDDSFLTDLDVINTLGIFGRQDSTQGHLQLGSSGPLISGVSGKVGIGTASPGAKLDITSTANLGGLRVTGSGVNSGVRLVNSGAGGKIWNIMSTGGGHASGDGKLQFGHDAGNTPAMVIGGTGNVGVGTTTPGHKLVVQGTTWDNDTGADLQVRGTGAGGGVTLIPTSSASNEEGWSMYAGGPGAWVSDGNLGFVAHKDGGGTTSLDVKMIIERSGNVGIGTTIPSDRLSLFSASADTSMSFQNDSNVRWHIGTETSNLSIGYGAAHLSNKVMNFSGSNVGIGTTSPASKLHIDSSGAGGGVCVTSDGTCSAVPTGGQISAETTLNTGADYAEYFESEEDLAKGDLVGLNPLTGKARGYQPGDHLLGLVSTDPGVIGNSDLATQSNTVLVALVGQVPFNHEQVTIKDGKILTKDKKPIGYLLASGNAYISLSSADQDQNQQIQNQNQLVVKLSRQISSLKQENLKKSKSIEDLNKRLEIIEKLMKK